MNFNFHFLNKHKPLNGFGNENVLASQKSKHNITVTEDNIQYI